MTRHFLFTLLFAALPAFSQSNSHANPLVGTWTLTAADKILPDGKQVPDYGTDPHGIAIFTADGRYTVEIFRADRVKFASGDSANGTLDEYKSALLTMSCHFGRYTIDLANGTITFVIDSSSFPNLAGTTQVRNFTLHGDQISWRVPPRPDGSIPISIFKRAQ
jgi:hypothetical protein